MINVLIFIPAMLTCQTISDVQRLTGLRAFHNNRSAKRLPFKVLNLNIGIVGLGLMGGSFAKAVKKYAIANKVSPFFTL